MQRASILFHRCGIDTVETLSGLDAVIFGDAAYSKDLWRGELAVSSNQVWLAEKAGEAVGFLSAGQSGLDLEIRKVGTLPVFQRQGIASTLLQHLIETNNGAERLLIDVSHTNEAALAFYERWGFARIHRRPRYYSDGSDAIVMEKGLAGGL